MKNYLSSIIYHLSFNFQIDTLKNQWKMKNDKYQIRESGFTLIELLIVVAIIGILSSLLMANFIGIRQRARDAQRKSDLRQIQSALEIFRADFGAYPTSDQYPSSCGGAFSTENSQGQTVTYMQEVPCDPLTGLPFEYTPTEADGTYTLVACLENENDSQVDKDTQDPPQPIACAGNTSWQYTLQNP